MVFSGGQYLTYNVEKSNFTGALATAQIVIGFRTDKQDGNVGLAQLEGQDSRHYSLALINGYATLLWNLNIKNELNSGTGSLDERATEVLQISKRQLNDGKHHVIKMTLSTRNVIMSVSDYGLSVVGNISEKAVFNQRGDIIGMELQAFKEPKRVVIGQIRDVKMNPPSGIQLPLSYSGCMSGAKFVYTPHATKKDPFPQAWEFDLFKMYLDDQLKGDRPANQQPEDNVWFGSQAPTQLTGDQKCGQDLPIPGREAL